MFLIEDSRYWYHRQALTCPTHLENNSTADTITYRTKTYSHFEARSDTIISDESSKWSYTSQGRTHLRGRGYFTIGYWHGIWKNTLSLHINLWNINRSSINSLLNNNNRLYTLPDSIRDYSQILQWTTNGTKFSWKHLLNLGCIG